MFDYPVLEKATPMMILWCILLYIIFERIWCSEYINNNISLYKNKVFSSIYFWLLLFALTCFCNGDFYHMIEGIQSFDSSSKISKDLALEVSYQWLAFFLGGNYLLWRMVVWGAAISIIGYTAKRLGIQPQITHYLVFTLYLIEYSYARSTLAQSIYFLGLSYLISPNIKLGRIANWIIAIVFMSISINFHRSMYILIAITPIIIAPRMSGKKNIFLYLFYIVAICILTFYGSSLIWELDISTISNDEMVERKFIRYSEKDISIGIAKELLQYITYFRDFVLVVSLILMSKYEKSVLSKKISDKLLKIILGIMALGYSLSLVGDEFYTVSYRTLVMAFIPTCLLLGFNQSNSQKSHKLMKFIVYLGMLYSSYRLLYALYLA